MTAFSYAFVFPGQGAQKAKMGQALYEEFDEARTIFDKADSLLGWSVSELCFHGSDEDLRPTIKTQPALYVCSCAALEVMRSRIPFKPLAVCGHSVGEYAAIYASGAISFEKGLALVQKRAELMQQAADLRPGAMAAVLGLEAPAVKEVCHAAVRETGKIVMIANYNCPGQLVISGEVEGVEKASLLAREEGARRVLPVPVSGGFHSPLMVGAGDALYPFLREALFQQAKFPVVANVNAEYNKSGVDFAPLLTMQVSGSVMWEDSIRRVVNDGVTHFVEMGSGSVLAGLIKRISPEARVVSVQDPKSAAAAVEMFSTTEVNA